MEAPDWLTQAYMQDALRNYYKDPSLKVTACRSHLALAKGENFGGVLTKVQLEYETKGQLKQNSYIVKSSFESDAFSREKMAPYDIFNREMSIYEKVLPKLTQLLQEIGDQDELFAKAIRVDYERQALVFEDLSARGYVMADRTKGLDMEHTQLILRKLAKMHATSAALNEREHGCLEGYDRGFFNRHTNSYSSFFVGNVDACSRLVSQWPDFHHYGEKLRRLLPHYMEIGKRCFEPTKGHVNVLAHGDAWTNNLMFKYDASSGKLLDLIIIDFQYSFWGSPTLDLHYIFNTSLKEEMRLYKQDKLFEFYHGYFEDILKRLHYKENPVPNLEEFLKHAEEKRFYAFHSACIVQPVMLNEETEDADFNALMAEDERAKNFKNTIYKNAKVHTNLKNLLPVFDQRGLLDVNQCC